MFNSAKIIADLKTELATAQATLATTHTERDTALARITELEASLTERQTSHESALAALNAQHEAALTAAAEKAAAEKALAITDALASAGVPESKLPSRGSADHGAKEMTMTEFQKLPHTARNAFVRSGGKLVDATAN